jgi:D-alanine-D-alanine ligase
MKTATISTIGLLHKKRGNYVLQQRFAGAASVVDHTDSEVDHHEQALRAAGYHVQRFYWGHRFVEELANSKVDLVFNVSTLVEAAILEELDIPYVGSDTSTIALTLNKSHAKAFWQHAGLPTAPFHVAESEADCAIFKEHPPFDFPLFIKPLAGRGSAGIDQTSIVETHEQLVAGVRKRRQTIGQPVLIEPYLRGREITIGIIGNGASARVLPLLEIQEDLLTFVAKQHVNYSAYICPACLTPQETQRMQQLGLEAYRQLGLRDFARFDTILTESGPFLLEGNTFPGLMYAPSGQPYSYLSFMAHAADMQAQDLLDQIIQAACQRLAAAGPTQVSNEQ